MAVWSTGPSLAPCVRVLKEARPVIVALVDHRKARLFRYADRAAVLVDTIHARISVDAERHMGRPPGSGFHVGTRGPTRRDRTQRELRNATTHMLADVAARLAELAGRDAWILVGGNATVARATIKGLRSDLAHRAAYVERLTSSASPAEIGAVARQRVSRMRSASDARSIDAIVAGSESDGRGITGVVGVTLALEEGSVQAVYCTPAFMANQAADAEAVVRKALSTHALVEVVSGVAAQRLDEAGGVAAALRYPSAVGTTPELVLATA
jgi:stalled ribosome rescue protein Dom34